MAEVETERNSSTDFQNWLKSDACYAILESTAKSVLSWARKAKLPNEVLLLDEGDELQQLRSVAAFVWDVLNDPLRLENCRLQLADFLVQGNLSGLRSAIISRVINYCKDEQRKEQNSPFHYYYRRISHALSQAEDVQYDTNRGNAFYACSNTRNLPYLLNNVLVASDFMGWPHPGFPFMDIVKAIIQVQIARFFWDHALDELHKARMGEHLLAVKDLVSYVDRMYGLSTVVTAEQTVCNEDGEEIPAAADSLHGWYQHDHFGTRQKQRATAEDNLTRFALQADAAKLFASWKPKMCVSFYLYHKQNMTLKEVAERLGLGSAEAVRHHKDKADAALREYLLQWELTSGDAEKLEEERIIFLEALMEIILNNHPECRDAG